MSKQVEEPKMKKHVAKPRTPNYSEFDNRSLKADKATQTVSNKRLIKPILHSVGLTLGKSNPVAHNSANEAQFTKLLKDRKVSKLQYMLNPDGFMASVSKQSVL
jgi:hypothetical protein